MAKNNLTPIFIHFENFLVVSNGIFKLLKIHINFGPTEVRFQIVFVQFNGTIAVA